MAVHSLSSLFLAFLLIGLPGISLSFLLLYRQNKDWLAHWQPIIFFIPLPAGFLVVSIIMETLVLLGKLSFTRVLSLSLTFSALTLLVLLKSIRFDHFKRMCRIQGNFWVVVPYAFFMLYIVLTVVPFDFIFDSTDCGTYVSSGINAFKTGSFRFYDLEIAEAEQGFIDSFYCQTPPELYSSAADFHFEGILGTGFFIRSLRSGLIEPRYFNLHPLWIGLFVKIFGLTPGVWLATPFLGLCGFIGIFLLSWVLTGRFAAILTAGLLSVFVLQIWFGRYITTEMSTQAALMNGLSWLLIFNHDRSKERNDGPVFPVLIAAMMIGISHFCRIDSILVAPALVLGIFIWIVFQNKTTRAWLFLSVYGMVLLAAILSAIVIAHSYTMETLVHVNVYQMTKLHVIMLIICFLLAFFLIHYLKRHSGKLSAFFQDYGKKIQTTLILLICLCFIYGLVFRPILNPPDYKAFYEADSTTRSRSLSQMTLRWLSWYLSVPMLLAAIIGLSLLFYNKWSLNTAPVFLLFGLYGFYFLYALRCTPFHYWGMRRFIPVIIPSLLIGIGYLYQEAFLWSFKNEKLKVMILFAFAYLSSFVFFARDLHLIYRFVHWKGAIDTLEEISAAVPSDCRLILPDYPGCYLYVPLKLIYDKNVYMLQKSADLNVVLPVIRNWLNDDERVFVMSDSKPSIDYYEDFYIQPILEGHPKYPLMGNFVEKKPDKISYHQIHYYLVEITVPKTPEGNDVSG